MKFLFHVAAVCVFTAAVAHAFAQQRIEIQTRFVEFPAEPGAQPPVPHIISDAHSVQEGITGSIIGITSSTIEAIFTPGNMKQGLPKNADELAGLLEKAGDHKMRYKTPMGFVGIVNMTQEQGIERWLMGKGIDVWKTAATTIDKDREVEIGLTRKSWGPFGAMDLGETAILKVAIGPDGQTLDLTINPKTTGILGWLSKGKDGKPMLMPIPKKGESKDEAVVFSESAFEKPQTVSIWDGQTVLVKGERLEMVAGAQEEKPKLVWKSAIMMITARLVDQHGNPVNQEEKEEEVTPLATPLGLPPLPAAK